MELRWPARRPKKPVEMELDGERVQASTLTEVVAAVQALGYRTTARGRNRVEIHPRGHTLVISALRPA